MLASRSTAQFSITKAMSGGIQLRIDSVPEASLSAESGPCSSWHTEMNHETRQFMAFQAIEEAFYILKQLTIRDMMGVSQTIRLSSKGGQDKVKSVFLPLLLQIDRMYASYNESAKTGPKVCAMGPMSAKSDVCKYDSTGYRGFRGWYFALRLEKQRLWTELSSSGNIASRRSSWDAAMFHLAQRCELLATCVMVCIHKNVRGFPETGLMRRYAQYAGGTTGTVKVIGTGEFGVENLNDHYKGLQESGLDPSYGDYADVDFINPRTNAIICYGAWYGDWGMCKPVTNRQKGIDTAANAHPNKGKKCEVRVGEVSHGFHTIWPRMKQIESKKYIPDTDAAPHFICIGAGWAMTDGWLNDHTFEPTMDSHRVLGNDKHFTIKGHRTQQIIKFSEETRFRYGVFPFLMNHPRLEKLITVADMLGRGNKYAIDLKRLIVPLSENYMDNFKLVYRGKKSKGVDMWQLPAIQDWYEVSTGRPYEGAFLERSLTNEDSIEMYENNPKGQWRDQDPWVPGRDGVSKESHYPSRVKGFGLEQPGNSQKGAQKDNIKAAGYVKYQQSLIVGRGSRDLIRVMTTPTTPKRPGSRGEMYQGPIPDTPQFGPPGLQQPIVIHIDRPEGGQGRPEVSVGPFSFKGEGAQILGLLMILLLLYFLFR